MFLLIISDKKSSVSGQEAFKIFVPIRQILNPCENKCCVSAGWFLWRSLSSGVWSNQLKKFVVFRSGVVHVSVTRQNVLSLFPS